MVTPYMEKSIVSDYSETCITKVYTLRECFSVLLIQVSIYNII